ncbi:OmpA family protein [Ekhidna sp.]|uniref:OmpA family protein n=1 Tax=Ekhidna sp. TaxID=2608089 RepID=UPI003BABD5BF
MAFFTEIGKKYNVTGVMGGWDNYTPANPADEHSRGESTGTAVLQLKGKVVEVTSLEHWVEEGHPAKEGDPFAPYEVVKVIVVGGDGTEYYGWVVYDGVKNVEEVIEQEDPPDPPDPIEDPDPPVEPPKPDEELETNGNEVHVRAGETVVLELETEGKRERKFGSLEVQVKIEEGQEMPQKLFLQNTVGTQIEEIKIDTNPQSINYGIGEISNVEAGEYELIIKPELKFEGHQYDQIVYFDKESKTINKSANESIEKLAQYLRNQIDKNINTVVLEGYANEEGSKTYADNLKIERSVAVKKLLTNKLVSDSVRLETRISINEDQTDFGSKGRKVEAKAYSDIDNFSHDRECYIDVNEFKYKDIHTILGESAIKKGAAPVPQNFTVRVEIPNYKNTEAYYQSYLPESKIDGVNGFKLISEEALNVYKFRVQKKNGGGLQATYDSDQDTSFSQKSLMILIDGNLALLTITQVTENDNDAFQGDSGRRIYGYYQIVNAKCQLSKQKIYLRTAKHLGHYVFRRGIDLYIENNESPKDTHSSIKVIIGQRIRDNDLAEELLSKKNKLLESYFQKQESPDWYPKIEELMFIKHANETNPIYQEAISNIENIKNRIQPGEAFELGCPRDSGENRALIWFEPKFEISNVPEIERSLITTETNYNQTTGFNTDYAFKFDFKRSAWGGVWVRNKSGVWMQIKSLGREIGSDDDIGPYGEVYNLDEYLPDLFFSIDESIAANIQRQISSDSPAIYLDENNQIPVLKDKENNVIHDFTDDTDIIKLGSFVEWVEVQFVKRTIPGNNIPMYESVDGHKKARCSSVKGDDYMFWHTVIWLQNNGGEWARKSSFESGKPRDADDNPTNKIETGFIKIPETSEELQQFLSKWKF